MPPVQHRPLASFGKELTQVLLSASKERITLNFTTERGGFAAATLFRQRLYQLRTSMRKHKHEHYEMVSSVKATIRWPADTPTKKVGRGNVIPADSNAAVTLIIGPQDLDFVDVVREAGIVDPLVDTSTSSTEHTPLTPDLPTRERFDEDDLLDRILGTPHRD